MLHITAVNSLYFDIYFLEKWILLYATMVTSSTTEKFHNNFIISSATELKDDFFYLF